MNPNQYTEVKFNEEALALIYEGVHEVCEATATTLGPLGRNVLIDKGYETTILHDGVSVADSINPQDPWKRNGARIIQEAAKKQRDQVGDGTTAAVILSDAIVIECKKVIASGINPMLLRRGLESGAEKVVSKLEELSTPVTTLEQKIQIATISAENATLGKMVAETVHKVGKDGVITVDTSKALDTFVEMQEGMQIDKGFAHSFMMTDPEKQVAILEDIPVLVTDYSLNTLEDIGEFLENIVLPNTKKCFFIAPEIGNDFLTVLLGAKIKGAFLGIAMRSPGIGSMQTEMLQDICALTGATFISKEGGMKFSEQKYDVLGNASRIVCSKISTIITGGAGHRDDVLKRIQVIKAQQEDETLSDHDHEQLKGRLAKLTNGVAVIKVGGQTDIEAKERYERALDAVLATQSACKYGLVPGGEVSYLSAMDELDESILGEKILKEALKAPFKRLVENGGYDSGEKFNELHVTALTAFAKKKPPFPVEYYGFDVTDGNFKNMVYCGIIDPTSVPTTAVKTAVSVAVQLSSLGAGVVLKNAEK